MLKKIEIEQKTEKNWRVKNQKKAKSKIKSFGLIMLFVFLTVQAYSQKCWYDYHEIDPITGNEVKGITFSNAYFFPSWQLGLNKHGNQYFVSMYISLSGNTREIITPENTIIFKLENGEIVTIHANENYVPTSEVTIYGFSSWLTARYYISEDDLQRIASSRLTYVRVSIGPKIYDGSFSKRKGKQFQSNAKCIML